MQSGEPPRYSLPEIERRWLADVRGVGDLAAVPFRLIEDLYIAGTGLRLRKMTGPGGVVFKLGKKYGRAGEMMQPVTNLYISQPEFEALSILPGLRAIKRRYAIAQGSLDLYESPRAGLAIFEIEFESEDSARSYEPPAFVTREVTHDPSLTGWALAS